MSVDGAAVLVAGELVGLAITVFTAVVTGVVSADIGEAFNARVAVYAAIWAAVAVALFVLALNLVVLTPWPLDEAQAARIREFERRPDVGLLIGLRERGVHLLNRDVDSEVESLPEELTDEAMAA